MKSRRRKMEYSLFMIKPCAYEKKDEILEIISNKLSILFTRDIILNEKFLNKLYTNEKNTKFKRINTDQLKNGTACIGIVAGVNAIKDLIEICGNKPLGTMCNKETIRYKFSPKNDTLNIGNEVFFLNAIHKSDPEEALDDVVLFITEFLQEEIKKSNIDYESKDKKEMMER